MNAKVTLNIASNATLLDQGARRKEQASIKEAFSRFGRRAAI